MIFSTDPPAWYRSDPPLAADSSIAHAQPYVAVIVARLSTPTLCASLRGGESDGSRCGDADIYVHDGGMYHGNSAAPAAVALAAGLHVSRIDGSPRCSTSSIKWLPDPDLPGPNRRPDTRSTAHRS